MAEDETRSGALSAALDAEDGLRARRHLDGVRAEGARRDEVVELLARRASAGSALAVELLVETVDGMGLARSAVHRVLVDEAAIEDVAQDTLIAVATSIRSFRGDAKFTTWLHQIARNRAIDHLRRQRATAPLDEHDMGDAQRISSVIASRETARQMVGRLQTPYREAVLLRDVEQASYAEVAEQLGITMNTVKSRVARGRALLARMIEPEAADG